MRRIYPVLVVVLVLLGGLILYLVLARPVVVLPPVTVALSENNALAAYERLLKVDEFDLTLRTDGRLSVAANGQRLACLSCNLDSLKNSADLAGRFLMPPLATLLAGGVLLWVVFPLVLPHLVWGLVLAGLYVYYILPFELTLRLVRG